MNRQEPKHFEAQITKTARLDYLLYLPKGYGNHPSKQWPLILFLHGVGERGNDLGLVKLFGLPHKLERGDDLPFVIVSPQCPAESYWLLLIDDLITLVEDITNHYAVDPRRRYLTGMSMGGT